MAKRMVWILIFAGIGCSPSPTPSAAPVVHSELASVSPSEPVASHRIVDRPPRSRDACSGSLTESESAEESEFAGIWPHQRQADLKIDPDNWSDPEFVAREFLRLYVGMPDPRSGTFQAGEPGAGEVPVRRGSRGPTTTVVVRQLGTQGRRAPWTVIAAHSTQIRVQTPGPWDLLSNRAELSGESTAFEAVVNFEVRQNGDRQSRILAEGIVMGGSNGDFAAFREFVRIPPPQASAGAVLFFTQSAEDGAPMEASVVKVRFAGASRGTRQAAHP